MTEEDKKRMAAHMKEAMPVMRKSLNITQSELSVRSGVSRAVISNVERGIQPLSWDAFVAITAVFRSNPTSSKMFDVYGIDLKQLQDFFCVESQRQDPSKSVL